MSFSPHTKPCLTPPSLAKPYTASPSLKTHFAIVAHSSKFVKSAFLPAKIEPAYRLCKHFVYIVSHAVVIASQLRDTASRSYYYAKERYIFDDIQYTCQVCAYMLYTHCTRTFENYCTRRLDNSARLATREESGNTYIICIEQMVVLTCCTGITQN